MTTPVTSQSKSCKFGGCDDGGYWLKILCSIDGNPCQDPMLPYRSYGAGVMKLGDLAERGDPHRGDLCTPDQVSTGHCGGICTNHYASCSGGNLPFVFDEDCTLAIRKSDRTKTLYGGCERTFDGVIECAWSPKDCNKASKWLTPWQVLEKNHVCTCQDVRTGLCVMNDPEHDGYHWCAPQSSTCDSSQANVTFVPAKDVLAKYPNMDCRVCNIDQFDLSVTTPTTKDIQYSAYLGSTENEPGTSKDTIIIIAIVMGVVAGVALISLGVVLCCSRNTRLDTKKEGTTTNDSVSTEDVNVAITVT